MHLQLLSPVLLAFLLLACGSSTRNGGPDTPQGGSTSPGGRAGIAGSAQGGAAGSGGGDPLAACALLPTPSSIDVPEPSGNPGDIEILDWAGFSSAVSYTFDDANSSQIAHYDELQALGIPMTFYLQTGKASAADEIWAQALLDGHELGNHTKSHAQNGSGEDIDDATAFIEQRFQVTPYTMAAPYGDSSYVSLAETRFLVNRGVSGGSVSPNGTSNPFSLPCHIPAAGAEASALNSIIDAARGAGKWQIVLVHGFTGGSDAAYLPVDIEEFTTSVEHAKSFGDVWIDSVVHVGAYWIGQKLLSESTPEASEGGQVWSWTLPDHFPPRTCLRATVSGGTVEQDGKAVPRDSHGYYSIALDAGSVTVSP